MLSGGYYLHLSHISILLTLLSPIFVAVYLTYKALILLTCLLHFSIHAHIRASGIHVWFFRFMLRSFPIVVAAQDIFVYNGCILYLPRIRELPSYPSLITAYFGVILPLLP